MSAYIFFGAVSAVVAMLAAAFLDWKWPALSGRRITILAGSVFPFLLILLIIAGSIYFLSEDCPPDDVCDAGAMAFAGLVMMGSLALVISMVLGLAAGHWAIRYLRSA